jgi:spore coat protein U-like protein
MRARAFLALGAFLGLALAAVLAPIARAADRGVQSCVVSVTPLKFGNFNPQSLAGSMMTGAVVFNCTQSQPITIFMDRGGGPANGMRRMSGRGVLDYNIYFDAAGTRIWGDGTGGTQFYSNAAPPPRTNVVIPFFGRIPGGQRVGAAGPFDDAIVVRLNY